MQKYWNTVQDEQGRPRYGALVAVQQSGVNSTIYSDSAGLVPAANPLTTDATRGYFEFCAAPGSYDLVVSGVGFASYTITGGADVGMLATDVTTVQSGTGALTRTVSAALAAMVRSGDYDTTAHFNTAASALTETIGMKRLTFPSLIANAQWSLKPFDGGGGNDSCQLGYNLSSTVYTPNVLTEPQIWLGLESNFGGVAEIYFRFEGIGLSGNNNSRTIGYLEPFYASFNRTTGFIGTVAIRAENIVLQNTDQTSYVDLTSSRALIVPKTNVGSTETPSTTLHVHGATYGASFDGITVGDNLGSSRLLVGYTSTSISGSKLGSGQIIWGVGAESAGELSIGARGDVATGMSFYTSPDAGTTGLVLRMRISSQGIISASGAAQEILVGTSTALAAAGYAGFRANGTSGGFYDLLVNGTRTATFFADSTGTWLKTVTATPLNLETNDGALQVSILHTASAVNYLTLTGGSAAAVTIGTAGTATDVDIAITPKGAGLLKFGTNTAKAAEAFASYITIKDSGGTSRKVMVCA